MVYTDLSVMRNQFYQRAVSFNGFRDITLEDVQGILSLIKERKSRVTKPTSIFISTGLDNYIQTLRYLLNPKIGLELRTIDERLIYLILATDPNFETFNSFLASNIISTHDIESAPAVEQKRLAKERENALSAYETQVRETIGFYDPRLLKYESILKKGLLKSSGFFQGVIIPSINGLLKKADNIESFDNISSNILERIKLLKEKWCIEAKDPKDLNSLAYNILNNREIRLYTPEEQILFFILVADPDLRLLTIYEEESKRDRINERALKEVGFVSNGLIKSEQLYHDKFEPEKQVSAWTK